MRLALVNPNTSVATTETMVRIARAVATGDEIIGFTAPFGAALITDEAALAESARAVLALASGLVGFDGVIVAAFGDPALADLRRRLAVPVTGIAEASMIEAAVGGRPFAVATTTPDLIASIGRAAEVYGHGALFRGTFVTPGDPVPVMADPQRLIAALDAACRAAIAAGAEAVVIGGGPLALAARALAGRFAAELVEPVPAAVRLALHRATQSKELT